MTIIAIKYSTKSKRQMFINYFNICSLPIYIKGIIKLILVV